MASGKLSFVEKMVPIENVNSHLNYGPLSMCLFRLCFAVDVVSGVCAWNRPKCESVWWINGMRDDLRTPLSASARQRDIFSSET